MRSPWCSKEAPGLVAAGVDTTRSSERVTALQKLSTTYGQGIAPSSQAPALSGVVSCAREAAREADRLQSDHLLGDAHGPRVGRRAAPLDVGQYLTMGSTPR
jgi:hypothetical protein